MSRIVCFCEIQFYTHQKFCSKIHSRFNMQVNMSHKNQNNALQHCILSMKTSTYITKLTVTPKVTKKLKEFSSSGISKTYDAGYTFFQE